MEQQQRDALVSALAALSDEDRRAIVRDARALSARAKLPWSSLRAVIGIVHGAPADAVEDTFDAVGDLRRFD